MQDGRLQDDFLKVTENASDVIGLFDVDGRALYGNAQAQALRGPANDAEPFQQAHPGDPERIGAEYAETVRTGKARRRGLPAPRRARGARVVRDGPNPVPDAGGGGL